MARWNRCRSCLADQGVRRADLAAADGVNLKTANAPGNSASTAAAAVAPQRQRVVAITNPRPVRSDGGKSVGRAGAPVQDLGILREPVVS